MANIVLVVALIVEMAFAAYCIVTKSRQREARNWMRIGALVAFALLVLISVIQWSTNWFGLALLLAVWAALGAWGLLRAKAHTTEFKAWTVIRNAIMTLLLLALALVPEFIYPQYKPVPTTGTHPVATVSFSYTDPNRIETFTNTGLHRQVNVEFWYPSDGKDKYPLVVFSHGSLGAKRQNYSTYMELASNGYVVCAIDHPYIAVFTMGADRRPVLYNQEFARELVDVNAGKYDSATAFQIEKKWIIVPVGDIEFVLDTILNHAKDPESETVYQLVDPTKIGLMGHSLGGESAAEVARERSDIGAVVDLDADLDGEYVSYTGGKVVMRDTVYPVPFLAILADDLAIPIEKVPDYKNVVAVEHVAATAPQGYLVHIKGTDHFSVTDLHIISPFFASMLVRSVPRAGAATTADKYYVIETVNHLVLTFFNTYLKGRGAFAPAAEY